jgi:uncharacterized membrane-anchored protein
MRKLACLVFVSVVVSSWAFASLLSAQPQESLADRIKWQKGPGVGALGSIAEVNIPEGYIFANAADTRILMEAMQNPTSGRELGFIAPAKVDWFVVFEFDDVGYVRDDEKGSLNADAMLQSMKSGTESANQERKRRGWPAIHLVGWEHQPHYNEQTQNLEWAIRGESEGKLLINYNTRVLGRGGVMRVTLVTDPPQMAATLPLFKTVLSEFRFKQGHRYAEFRQGDKMAAYGLSALVVGGATAAAVKSGAFKWLWKAGLVGLIAAGGLFKKFFGRRTSA